jgi:hypothetical protein
VRSRHAEIRRGRVRDLPVRLLGNRCRGEKELLQAGQVLQEGEGLVLRSGQFVLRAATHVLLAGRVVLRPGGIVQHSFERARPGSGGQAV